MFLLLQFVYFFIVIILLIYFKWFSFKVLSKDIMMLSADSKDSEDFEQAF